MISVYGINAKGLLNVAAKSEAHAKDAWTLYITCRWNKLHAQVVAECNHYLYVKLNILIAIIRAVINHYKCNRSNKRINK